jgi:ArsR family transcriptional regulator
MAMETNSSTLATTANALSDPIRLQILDLLTKGHNAACTSPPHPELPRALCPYLDIQSQMVNITPSKLSYHLKELRQASLIEEHPLGKRVYYTINGATFNEFLAKIRLRFLDSAIERVANQELPDPESNTKSDNNANS